MENIFPHCKKQVEFSTVWKIFLRFFHAMENFFASFPHYGKLPEKAGFTGISGSYPGAVERNARRPM